jgi:hypothetical protein
MTESEDRVQQALAAHLDHAEFGGPEPDTSHLTAAEQDQLKELIALLEETEGVPFGRALEPGAREVAATDEGARLRATLRESLPVGARVAVDASAAAIDIPGMSVVEGFIVGTFGGRVRVWLLDGQDPLDSSGDWLRDLERVFRVYPDTVAIALVDAGHSCLLVQPEDCAPTIEVPRGLLAGRRYRRGVSPVEDALSDFLRELIPYWEPMEAMSEHPNAPVDVRPIAAERAARAVDDQVAAGGRARKTNPKRTALSELGDEEAKRVAKLALDVHDGKAAPDDVEDVLRKLARR